MNTTSDPNPNTSDQQPGGYYYQPYRDDGPFEKRLQKAGELVGKVLAQVGGEDPLGQKIASFAGGMGGSLAGFYLDNSEAIQKNLETLFQQLNDHRTWMDPASKALEDNR
jgi:hypothetical protein